MKSTAYMICVAILLTACHHGHNHNHDHDRSHREHEQHDHEGHRHDDHTHEGRNRNEHDHDEHKAADSDSEPVATSGSDHVSGEIVILPKQAEAAGLHVETVQSAPFDMTLKVSGQIQAAQGDEHTVAAPSNGIVSFARSLTEGAAVRKGEALVTLSAQNILEGDPVVKAKLTYEQAEREYRRATSLVKDTLISVREYEQAHTAYETAKVTWEALAQSRTSKGIVATAATDGYVKNRLIDEGTYVTAGQPLLTVSQNRQLQLRCDVPEKYYHLLASVTTANFRTPYDDTLYRLSEMKGQPASYGRSTETSSFHIPVTFTFDNTGNMAAGAFVEAYLILKPAEDVITVPLQAMIEEQGLYFVYVQSGTDTYLKREIKPGNDNGHDVRILAGLHAGDRVVTRGAIHVKLASNASSIPEHSHSH